MSVVTGDMVYYLSGGSTNTDSNASLGGAISSTAVSDGVDENLFDDVSSSEASAGDVEYRCIYLKNDNGTSDTLYNTEVRIPSDTAGGDDVELALGSSAIDGTEQTIVDEGTAPTGVTFNAPGTWLSIGDLAAGSHKAIWIKRNVPAATSNAAGNTFDIAWRGDTA